jgi:hypothetical protein
MVPCNDNDPATYTFSETFRFCSMETESWTVNVLETRVGSSNVLSPVNTLSSGKTTFPDSPVLPVGP